MNAAVSPCHQAPISASRGDGVVIGSCSTCGAAVCRLNPRTGVSEWLGAESPWSQRDDLRPMDLVPPIRVHAQAPETPPIGMLDPTTMIAETFSTALMATIKAAFEAFGAEVVTHLRKKADEAAENPDTGLAHHDALTDVADTIERSIKTMFEV